MKHFIHHLSLWLIIFLFAFYGYSDAGNVSGGLPERIFLEGAYFNIAILYFQRAKDALTAEEFDHHMNETKMKSQASDYLREKLPSFKQLPLTKEVARLLIFIEAEADDKNCYVNVDSVVKRLFRHEGVDGSYHYWNYHGWSSSSREDVYTLVDEGLKEALDSFVLEYENSVNKPI